jgi:succinyl-diaminopimelate desuccinylase
MKNDSLSEASLASRTLELVAIDSPIGHERLIGDHLQAWASKHFSPHEILRVGHSLSLGSHDVHRPTVLLVGHTDTVPAAAKPNPPRREGDRLFGLGSSDMKGALAVMMGVVEACPLKTLPFNVRLVWYEREEGPYLESGLQPLFEAQPDLQAAAFAIAMEPTDGAVQVGCVGSLHATWRFEGQAAHSARPWQGRNAIHRAASVLTDLEARAPKEVDVDGYSYREVMSATLAKGGRARNVVADLFELNVNYRFAPGKSEAQAQRDIIEFVAGRCEVAFTDVAPSGRVCADNAHFQRLVSLTGRPAEPKQAWTDVARLSSWGVDSVNFGPGETAQAHQVNESCSAHALAQAAQVLKRFIGSADEATR